ncbi:uncharacterized protein PRCAT00001765001 [Priceomyces carsonii]|uniref:uncharacterized protein n=1 Tax=Priceomyces carsonii TaxID=28549 RepID=UPI002ED96FEE|nr:unnamed protein product [Priceomyces carsonii]
MNFQATDYLNDLYIDVDDNGISPTLNDGTSPNDLDLFSHSDFFNLEAFTKKQDLPREEYIEKNESITAVEIPQITRDSTASTPSFFSEQEFMNVNAEDKRKRNTAASARFRIKKKMKEQQMEQRAKELEEKVAALDKKLKTLEMENKCLKNLVLQKNEKKSTDLLDSIKKRSMADSNSVFQYTS